MQCFDLYFLLLFAIFIRRAKCKSLFFLSCQRIKVNSDQNVKKEEISILNFEFWIKYVADKFVRLLKLMNSCRILTSGFKHLSDNHPYRRQNIHLVPKLFDNHRVHCMSTQWSFTNALYMLHMQNSLKTSTKVCQIALVTSMQCNYSIKYSGGYKMLKNTARIN